MLQEADSALGRGAERKHTKEEKLPHWNKSHKSKCAQRIVLLDSDVRQCFWPPCTSRQ